MPDPRSPDIETGDPGRFDEPVDPNNTEAPDLSPAEERGFDPTPGDATDGGGQGRDAPDSRFQASAAEANRTADQGQGLGDRELRSQGDPNEDLPKLNNGAIGAHQTREDDA